MMLRQVEKKNSKKQKQNKQNKTKKNTVLGFLGDKRK